MQQNKSTEKESNISILNRKQLIMTGVLNVYSFNDNDAFIETTKGPLIIKGKNFHLDKFDLGTNDLHMTGEIDSLNYKSKSHGKAIIGWFMK